MTATPAWTGVRLVAFDVDGVLTDGSLVQGPDGPARRAFHVHDGLGIRHLLEAGIAVAWLTGHASDEILARAASLGVTLVRMGVGDKRAALEEVCAGLGLPLAHVLYMADDVPDLGALAAVGFSVAPADARPEVRAAVHLVTQAPGGRGAVREVCDLVLSAKQRVLGVIPARYASSRFPGKPLALLRGVPMVVRVARRALRAKLDEVLVATDDPRIAETAAHWGIPTELTSDAHPSGTDRLGEVAARHPAAFYVNIQGDEPLIDPASIDDVVRGLRADPRADLCTGRTPLGDPADLHRSQVVKVVSDLAGYALYFSRSPIPFHRTGPAPEVHRHVGLYAYRRDALLRLVSLPPTPLERTESLEQLRALEHGLRIRVVDLAEAGHGVDLPEDLLRVEALLGAEEAP